MSDLNDTAGRIEAKIAGDAYGFARFAVDNGEEQGILLPCCPIGPFPKCGFRREGAIEEICPVAAVCIEAECLEQRSRVARGVERLQPAEAPRHWRARQRVAPRPTPNRGA